MGLPRCVCLSVAFLLVFHYVLGDSKDDFGQRQSSLRSRRGKESPFVPGAKPAHSTPAPNGKLAFLFLSRGYLHMEDIWEVFFRKYPHREHYSIYWHPAPDYVPANTSFFANYTIPNRIVTRFNDISMTHAAQLLVTEALKDQSNKFFMLFSESCVPLHPLHVFRDGLLTQSKSVVNACPFDRNEMEVDWRWKPRMTAMGLSKDIWRKSSQFFALNRKHAIVYANDTFILDAMRDVSSLDEHHLPTLLAYHGLDNETTCADGFTHVYWRSLNDWHPVTFGAEDVTIDLISHLRDLPKLGVGNVYNARCCGIDKVCHFAARKFSVDDRREMLDSLHWILFDGDLHKYNKDDPSIAVHEASIDHWEQAMQRKHVRIDPRTQKIYWQEDKTLREIVNNETVQILFIDSPQAQPIPLTPQELASYSTGDAFPNLSEKEPMKLWKQATIWLAVNGSRHAIPDYDTFLQLGFRGFKTVSSWYLSQFPVGPPLPSVNSKS